MEVWVGWREEVFSWHGKVCVFVVNANKPVSKRILKVRNVCSMRMSSVSMSSMCIVALLGK